MFKPPDYTEELYDLYEALHQTCARAASLLRLKNLSDSSDTELVAKFKEAEAQAAAIWRRIAELQEF